MKTKVLILIIITFSLISRPTFSQSENSDPLLGLPGDDLDLYAVLDLFQSSKTIEDFEKSLNDDKAGIVNLDLNNDGKVDFIKVTTEKEEDNYLFILQDPINEKETQDVAVISVSKDSSGKVSLQIIGDEKLYGKNYVVEPRTEPVESITANPAYVGKDPVTVNVKGTTQVVVVETTPVVQYIYSPAYVPYYPPYYYGYYPPYWRAAAVVAVGIYRHNHYHHHHHYRGGHSHSHTSVHIHNNNTYNKYNNNKRESSNTVNNNIKNGNFKTAGQEGSRPSTGQNKRTSDRATTANRSSNNARSQTGRSNNREATTNRSSNRQSVNGSSRSGSYNRSTGSRPMNSSRSMSPSRSGGGRRN